MEQSAAELLMIQPIFAARFRKQFCTHLVLWDGERLKPNLRNTSVQPSALPTYVYMFGMLL